MRNSQYLLFAIMILLTGCSKESKPETLVEDGYNESEMEVAIARARAEVDEFIDVYGAGDADSFSVKVPISDQGRVEHFWMSVDSFDGESFHGKIANEPGIVSNVKLNQTWQVSKTDLSDWMFTRGEMIHGGYTIDPLLDTMPEGQAEQMRAILVR